MDPLPNPNREVLARRIVESVNLVEIVMIESVEEWLKGTLHICEVDHPTGLRSDRASHVDLDPERMSVEPAALVPRWDVRQPMRRLNREFFEDIHLDVALHAQM